MVQRSEEHITYTTEPSGEYLIHSAVIDGSNDFIEVAVLTITSDPYVQIIFHYHR